ncbi:hypothetical protein SLS62_004918 [Diatrype stigma]|uniref:UBC core domain-containing protein n=1 Tax=Diatrype stigma TaxID=117547 RepID=A0AAN9YTC8_9PEZI
MQWSGKAPTAAPIPGGHFCYISTPMRNTRRFLTKIKHPSVNAHGRICHSIFDRDWTSDISTTALLDTVYALLYQPEYSDPVNTTTILRFHHDAVEFADEVRAYVHNHALTSREDWKTALLD